MRRKTKKVKKVQAGEPNVPLKRPIAGLIILISLVVIILVGSIFLRQSETGSNTVSEPKQKIDVTKQLNFGSVNDFEDVYDGIVMIDQKYGISFKKEVLFGLMINKEYFPHLKKDIDALRKKLDPAGTENIETFFSILPVDRTERQLGLIFIDARKKMIESQEKFHRAYSSGTQGLVGDGFSCREEPVILASIDALNESAKAAATAKHYLDEMLTDTQDITWDFVGVEDAKPLFYHSPSEFMWAQLKVNKAIIREYCHSDIHVKTQPRDMRSVSFDQAKHKDLFINPRLAMSPKQWQLLTAPLNPSASSFS